MNYLKIKKVNRYRIFYWSNDALYVLGSFMTEEFTHSPSYVLQEIALDGVACMNAYSIEIKDNIATIEESCPPDEGEEPRRFITSANNMMNILYDWGKLVDNDVESIIIYERNGQFVIEPEERFSGDVRSVLETHLMHQTNKRIFAHKNEERYVIAERTQDTFYSSSYTPGERILVFQYAAIESNNESLVLLFNEFFNQMCIKVAFDWRNRYKFNPVHMESVMYDNKKIIIHDEVPCNKELGQHPLESVVLDVDVFFNFLEQLLPLYEQYVKKIAITYDGQSFKVTGHN